MCNPRREQAAERQIQKQVLQLLQQVGPTNYNLLLVQFDLYSGYLEGASNWDSRKMVCITVAGYRRLDDMKYWSKA